ncbi:hypothetical protein Leryth_012371 [Lithospermum erythrorhizon]|nr:hypothetical protein Leryth_012371 [Lithospermum erythrorhizon]
MIISSHPNCFRHRPCTDGIPSLQCYHCSTMQVKQQKKSSNKWTCVVCNQKQSVTKIYARAFMAKDVRYFVQSFNMSRLAADQQIANNMNSNVAQSDGNQTVEVRQKKRTDWSEFIDNEDDNSIENDEDKGNAFEPKVVTELPKETFIRPKLKNPLNRSLNNDNGYKPVFQKRNNSRKRGCHGECEVMELEPNECQQMTPQGSDQLTDYRIVPGKEFAKFQQSMGPLRRKVYETRGGDYDYERYEVTRQQKTTANVSFRCYGNTVEDGRSSGTGDFPEKQYAKSEFAAIALKWKGNGVEPERGSESLEATRHQKKTATIVSKWNDYITEDDDEAGGYSGNLHGGSCRVGPTIHWKSDMYDINSGDQNVEEDVHPDFL